MNLDAAASSPARLPRITLRFGALLVRLGTLLCLAACAAVATAQPRDFPNRALKVLVSFTAGSGADITARFFAEQLSAVLGQPVVVDNRAGAGGIVAVQALKAAPADGYTIFLASSTAASVNPIVVKDLPYDPLRDMKPISGLTRNMALIVISAEARWQTLADLVAAAKSGKESLKVGNYSELYLLHLIGFSELAGVKFLNVPYKGAPQALADLLGRNIDFTIMDPASAAPLLKSGKIRALAISGKDRSVDLPDVPTFAESGYPNYVYYGWNAFYVRSETADDVTKKLADAMQQVLATSAARDFARKIGVELMPLGTEAMQKFHRDDLATLRRVADSAGIKPR